MMNDIKSKVYKFNYSAIEEIWYIMLSLSDTTASMPEVSQGEHGTYMFSCETMMSAMNTIISIDFCCDRGAYSDAYTLIRKYRDDLMQYLFVLNVIQNLEKNSYSDTEDFNFIELLSDPEKLFEILQKDMAALVSGEKKTDAEKAMEAWIHNKLEYDYNYRKRYFDTVRYKDYLIRDNNDVKYVMDNFLFKYWKDVDRKLNNYVHGNGKKYIQDNYVYKLNKKSRDTELIETLQDITSLFLSLLAIIDSTKLRSSDYLDALEMGFEPEQESAYWICPCIVEYMNDNLEKELLGFLQNREKNGMKYLGEYYT